MSSIRVLVVDDSSTMRQLVASVLSRAPGIEVVGEARDALEARQAIKLLNPDVMTLDVEMPNMNGLEFLDKVMRLRPMPVIMVSTLTAAGSDTAVAALESGAVDCVVKPTRDNPDSLDDLVDKVFVAARTRPRHVAAPARAQAAPAAAYSATSDVVAIGSSTGGVEALYSVLSKLPANCPPVVVTQHMPPHFTQSLANRLDRSCAPKVAEATDGAPLIAGHVYLAPGGERHLEVIGRTPLCCRLKVGDLVNGHRPSVDVLFESVARHAGRNAVGVILTGMGCDGARGLAGMKAAGARTIGQNEASCVVYGMPKAAHDLGAVDVQLPLERIGAEIVNLTNALQSRRAS